MATWSWLTTVLAPEPVTPDTKDTELVLEPSSRLTPLNEAVATVVPSCWRSVSMPDCNEARSLPDCEAETRSFWMLWSTEYTLLVAAVAVATTEEPRLSELDTADRLLTLVRRVWAIEK